MVSHTILIIEDNDHILELFSELLTAEGYHVIAFADGQSGLEAIYEHQPDLILCDMMMPEMNGWEVLRNAKMHQKTSVIPFVLMSGSSALEVRVQALHKGACAYLEKPFTVDNLLNVVSTCLNA